MKRRDDNFETFEADRAILDSLESIGRLRVTVSVEDRVMAAVRAQAAARPRRAALDLRQKAALGSAAAAGVVSEIVFWAAVAVLILQYPGFSGVRVRLGWMPDPTSTLVTVARAGAEVVQAIVSTLLVVVNGAAYLLPPASVLGAVFVVAVSFLTFIAVRRDLHRSPAARGFQ